MNKLMKIAIYVIAITYTLLFILLMTHPTTNKARVLVVMGILGAYALLRVKTVLDVFKEQSK